jgi:hypothetical protein
MSELKPRADSVESIGDGIVGADQIAGIHTALSEGEQRFETIRRTVGLFLGPLVLVLVLLLRCRRCRWRRIGWRPSSRSWLCGG